MTETNGTHLSQPANRIMTRYQSAILEASSTPTNGIENLTAYREKMVLMKEKRKKQGERLAKLMKEKQQKGVVKKKPLSKSSKSGLLFPVHTMLNKLKKANPHCRVQTTASVYISGVLEYLTAEMLELAGNASIELKRSRITPRHLYLAVGNDPELDGLLSKVTISQGGVMPKIHPSLLCTKKEYAKRLKNQAEVSSKVQQTNETSSKSAKTSKEKNQQNENNESNSSSEKETFKRKSIDDDDVDDDADDDTDADESKGSSSNSSKSKKVAKIN